MNIKLEEVTKCPICTKNDCIDKYSKVYDYLNRDFQREYELSSCRECRHSFLSKRPIEEEIYKFYEKHYYTHENKKKSLIRCITQKFFVYGLGRGLNYRDREAVDNVVGSLGEEQVNFADLLFEVLKSKPFQFSN